MQLRKKFFFGQVGMRGAPFARAKVNESKFPPERLLFEPSCVLVAEMAFKIEIDLVFRTFLIHVIPIIHESAC